LILAKEGKNILSLSITRKFPSESIHDHEEECGKKDIEDIPKQNRSDTLYNGSGVEREGREKRLLIAPINEDKKWYHEDALLNDE